MSPRPLPPDVLREQKITSILYSRSRTKLLLDIKSLFPILFKRKISLVIVLLLEVTDA